MAFYDTFRGKQSGWSEGRDIKRYSLEILGIQGGSDWVKNRSLVIIIHFKNPCINRKLQFSVQFMMYLGRDGTVFMWYLGQDGTVYMRYLGGDGTIFMK